MIKVPKIFMISVLHRIFPLLHQPVDMGAVGGGFVTVCRVCGTQTREL